MIKIGAKSENNVIELCDLKIENSDVLTGLFDVIINNQCFLDQSADSHKGIIQFMQKYDFERDLSHISLSLQADVGGERAEEAFAAASHLRDWKLCGRIIANDALTWGDIDDDDEFGKPLSGADIF
jgi:hypothetical protein